MVTLAKKRHQINQTFDVSRGLRTCCFYLHNIILGPSHAAQFELTGVILSQQFNVDMDGKDYIQYSTNL